MLECLLAHAPHHGLGATTKDALDLTSLDLLDGDLVLLVDAVALCFVADEDAKALGVVVHPVVFHAGRAFDECGAIGADDNFRGCDLGSSVGAGLACVGGQPVTGFGIALVPSVGVGAGATTAAAEGAIASDAQAATTLLVATAGDVAFVEGVVVPGTLFAAVPFFVAGSSDVAGGGVAAEAHLLTHGLGVFADFAPEVVGDGAGSA